MKNRLLLFDIDGTLMLSGGSGREAIRRTCLEILGVEDAMEGIPLHGRIDPNIFSDAVTNAGVPTKHHDKVLRQVMERYFELLPGVIQEIDQARALRGVRDTLNWLESNISTAVMGLATGNFRTSAMIKLSSVSLTNYFEVGGFGEDGEVRFEVLEAGWKRTVNELGWDLRREDVLVIGDTTRDIKAARDAGMQVAAVATGSNSLDELRAAEPDWVWEDMVQGLEWFQSTSFFS